MKTWYDSPTQHAWLTLPSGQHWPPEIGLQGEAAGVKLPSYCSYESTGYQTLGHGDRVLHITTGGSKIGEGINAAKDIADRHGLGLVQVANTQEQAGRNLG